MSRGGFEALGGGRYRVAGELGFDTVRGIWEQSRASMDDAAEAEIDLGSVTEVDSAGLALVIEWVGWAQRHQKGLRLTRVPEKLLALARMSEVEDLLNEALPRP